jgi:hypothetical protein
MPSTDLDAWLQKPIDWEACEEVRLALLDDRGGDQDTERNPERSRLGKALSQGRGEDVKSH